MKCLFDKEIVKKNLKFFICLVLLCIFLIVIDVIRNSNTDNVVALSDEEIEYQALVINEIMSSNTGIYVDEDGNNFDWIEIYNGTEKDIDLSNYGLSDKESGEIKWQFPNTTIKSKEYLVVYLSGDNKNELHANFALNKEKEELITLKSVKGKVIDSVRTKIIDKNNSMARDEKGDWIITNEITPGYSNNKDGRDEYLKSLNGDEDSLILSEILPKNKGIIMYDGNFDDCVEIENISDKTINLNEYFISNDINVPFKWELPDVKLKPNQVYLIKSSEMTKDDKNNFHLDSKSGMVVLSHKNKIIEKVEYSNITNGYAYIRNSGSFVESIDVSFGYKNDEDGKEQFNKNERKNKSDLIINEVMNYNDKYLKQDDNYYDWIELYNNTNHTIKLSDYYITNDTESENKDKLPDKELKAHEYYILMASGDDKKTNKDYTHVNFKLSSEEGIYLYKNDKIVDYMFIANVPLGSSYGRGSEYGLYYFKNPTPNKSNDFKNTISISYNPIFSIKPGIYNDKISLELKGSGDIYYTLDGSKPSKKSKKYKDPIKIDKTTVIKMISYQDGNNESNVITGSYIVNEKHTLPVLSISLDDNDFSKLNKNLESSMVVNAHAELYEKDSSFSIDCGMKLFGGQTRFIPKKSFALKFSSKYGQSKLKYKVFDNREADKYDTIVVRSGSQDSEGAMIRDELATSIMNDYGTVDVQDYKPVILYINGKYWGIYFIREKVDEEFVSNHYNVSEDGTNIVRIDNAISAGSSKDYNSLKNYINSHDMTKDESYKYVSEHLDIDNFIDYLVGELYTTNNDIVNTRYFNNPNIDNGKIKMIFYDFDYAFYNYDRDYMSWLTNKNGLGEHHYNNDIIKGLFKNKKFKDRFLERLSYNLKNVWTDENVKKRYNELYKLIEPEVERNQKRWNRSYSDWKKECKILEEYINKRRSNLLSSVKSYFKLSDEEMKKYFE